MNIKIAGAILGITIGLSTVVSVPLCTYAAQEQEVTVQNSKIEPELQSIIDNAEDDERISICVWLRGIDDATIDELLSDVSVYKERLIIIEKSYSAIIDAFLARYFDTLERDQIIYRDIYNSAIMVKVTKNEIWEYENDDEIERLSFYKDKYLAEDTKVILIEARAAARAELRGYKNMEDYRETQQKELQVILTEGIRLINTAETVEDIRTILTSVEAEMDGIKNDWQLTQEETFDEKEQQDSSDSEEIQPELKQEDNQDMSGIQWESVKPDKQKTEHVDSVQKGNEDISEENAFAENNSGLSDVDIIQPVIVEEKDSFETKDDQSEIKQDHVEDVPDGKKPSGKRDISVVWLVIAAAVCGGSIWFIKKRR